ncbi:MAG: hypothetical protein GY711_27040 [bacterium]|nr:hypothetical protein [bacterium]
MKRTLCPLLLLLCTSPAQADISAWLAAVAAGTPAAYVDTNILAPTNVDIGALNPANGATYEFIVNGTNAGISSALMGARGTGVGDSAGLKFEQYPDTTSYGLTNFGVADYTMEGNVESVDVHLVFVADVNTSTTTLYADGQNVATAPYAPVLSGMVGILQAHDPNGGDFDPLTGTMLGVAVYDSLLSAGEILDHYTAWSSGTVGTSYCGPAIPNSTGFPAIITGGGSASVAANNFSITAEQLPPGQFGYFLVGQTQGFFNPPGSQGIICLVGNIGRYNQIANIIQGPTGTIQVDLTAVPVNPTAAVMPGETWSFQCWFRDNNPTLTNNFTDGLEVTFL